MERRKKRNKLSVSHFGQHQRRRKFQMLFLLVSFYNRRKSSDFLLHSRSYKLSRDEHWTAKNGSRQTKIHITQLCSIFCWTSILGSWGDGHCDAFCIDLPRTKVDLNLRNNYLFKSYLIQEKSTQSVEIDCSEIATNARTTYSEAEQEAHPSKQSLCILPAILDDTHRISLIRSECIVNDSPIVVRIENIYVRYIQRPSRRSRAVRQSE